MFTLKSKYEGMNLWNDNAGTIADIRGLQVGITCGMARGHRETIVQVYVPRTVIPPTYHRPHLKFDPPNM